MIPLPPRRPIVYYIQGLLPWPLMVFILYKMSSSHYGIILFSVAYFWHFALNTPADYWESYLKKRRYRFSSMRMVLLFHRFLEREIHPFFRYPPLIRLISPSLFNLLLMGLSREGNFLYSLAGSLLFEGISHLFNKRTYAAKK